MIVNDNQSMKETAKTDMTFQPSAPASSSPAPYNNSEFLQALAGPLKQGERLWTCSFTADPATVGGSVWRGRPHTGGDVDIDDACNDNTYFSVAVIGPDEHGTFRRQINQLVRMFVIVLDDVGTKADMPALDPTYLLQTSPGNYQAGYRLAEPITCADIAKRLLKGLQDKGKVLDRSGNNPVRYVRLPFGANTKAVHGIPFRHQLTDWHPDRTFTVEELCTAFDLDSMYVMTGAATNDVIQTEKMIAADILADHAAHLSGIGPDKTVLNLTGTLQSPAAYLPTSENIAIVEKMLSTFAPDKGAGSTGNRDKWVHTLWSVASLGWGDAGETIARTWSQQGELYDAGAFDIAWRSYDRRQGGITFGSLIMSARQAGYKGAKLQTVNISGGAGGDNDHVVPDWLAEMNKKYVWIEREASIYRLHFHDFIDPARFKTQYDNQTVRQNATGRAINIGKGTAWIRHPCRRQHTMVVMRPDEDQVTHDNCANSWRGFTHPPIAGDVRPWRDLLHRLFPADAERKYILQWLAHVIQRPAIKLNTALAIWSMEQGVGKNLLFEAIVSVIGNIHANVITQATLNDNNNSWNVDRIFTVADEALNPDRRADADKLKGLITSTKLRICEKYQVAREIDNRNNYVFLSNHNDALFIDGHDRRFFVCEIKAGKLPDYMAENYLAWRDNGGLSALHAYLREIDLTGFDPKAPAPMTVAKSEMVEDSKSDLETFLTGIMIGDVKMILGREVLSADSLAIKYSFESTNQRPPSAKAITNACKRLGAVTRRIHLHNGKKARVLAISRPQHWLNESDAAWLTEYNKPLKMDGGPVAYTPFVPNESGSAGKAGNPQE